MPRKLSLFLAAIAAVAFAAPSFASGATGLTEGGSLVAVGKTLRGTNIGSFVITSSKTGNITCKKVGITVELLTNTIATVKARGVSGRSTASECSVPSGAAITVPNITISELHTTGGGTGTKTFSFEIKIASLICKYSAVEAPITYNPLETSEGSDVITLSEVPLSVTPAACGTTSKLDGKLTMETDIEGSTVPVYIM